MTLAYFLQRAEFGQEPAKIQTRRIQTSSWPIAPHLWNGRFLTSEMALLRSALWAFCLSNYDNPEPRTSDGDGWNTVNLYPSHNIAMRNMRHSMDDGSLYADARQGFTIDPDGKLYVFVAWKGRLTMWTGKMPKVKGKSVLHHPRIVWDNWKEVKEERPDPSAALVVQTGVKETFFSYQDKTHYLFVTESGQVHSLPRKGKPEKTELVWQDKRRPVRLLIEDSATGTTWAFAPRTDPKKDKDVKDVFFPLAHKIETVEYKPADAGTIDRRKPLESALSHARFLTKQKKLGKQPAKQDKT